MAKTKETKGFYTVEQVADKLKLHWQTVLDYIRTGELKAMRLGKGYRIPFESFDEFVSERMVDVSLSALASSELFSAKPKDAKFKRYCSLLVVPTAGEGGLIPSTPKSDNVIRDIVLATTNSKLDPKSDVDGVASILEREGGEYYFRSTGAGVVFLRHSLFEPENQVFIRTLLSTTFRALKIAHFIYKQFDVNTPVLIKFRLVGVEGNVLQTGSVRRSLLLENRASRPDFEINEGPVELKIGKVSELTVKIVMRTLRGFGNNRLTVDILKDFLENIVEGKE